jgi:hypothetical protein
MNQPDGIQLIADDLVTCTSSLYQMLPSDQDTDTDNLELQNNEAPFLSISQQYRGCLPYIARGL